MKRLFRRNSLAHRALALVLALSLMLWGAPFAYADSENQSKGNAMVGGVVAIWADGYGLSKMAAEVLERGVIFGLCEAADIAENEHISELFSATKRLLAGPTGSTLAEIKGLCEEIQVEINEMQGSINDSTGVINASITELSAQLSSIEYDDYHNKLASFYVTYEGLYNDFVTWANALSKCANDPSEANQAALQAAYDKVNAYYEADSSSTTKNFNFDSDLQSFLSLISPYSSGAAVDFDVEPSDSSAWGQNLNTKTYFDALYDDLSYYHPFEHDMYVYMTAGMNETANALCMYLSAYKMYVEFNVQKIDADPSLSETEKTNKTQSLWLGYQEHAYKCYRGLEQAVSEYGNDITGYMRSYDTSLTVDMIYHSSYSGYSDYGSKESYDTKAKKTSSTMAVYQAKPIGDTSAYVIRKGSNTKITCGDLTMDAFTTIIPANNAYGPTADFMNLRYVDYPDGYRCVNGYWDLEDIYSLDAYALSGSLLVSFLKSQGYTDLPSISETSSTNSSTKKNGQFLVTPATEWDSDEKSIDDVQFTQWVNISQPLYASNPSNNQVSLDGDEGIHENSSVKNSEFMLMYYGNPVVTINTSAGSGGTVGVYEVQGHKQTYFASYNADPNHDFSGETNRYVASGGVLEIHVKPDEGKTIKSVTLKDANGNVLTDLVGNSEFSSESGDALTAQELLESLTTAEDGSYIFRAGVPYQNAKICVEFTDEDPEIAQHDVSLEKSSQGDLQFSSRTGVPTLSFESGSSASLSVRPYEGYLCTGVKLYRNYGTENQKDVTSELSLAETTDENSLYTPTAKTFSFTTPSYDVTAVAEYEKAPTTYLSVVNTWGGTLSFSGISCQNPDWLSYPVTFQEGDTVSITAEPGLDFKCKSLVAYKKDDSSVSVELTETEDGATFVMPAYDVVVRAEFSLVDVSGKDDVPGGKDEDDTQDTTGEAGEEAAPDGPAGSGDSGGTEAGDSGEAADPQGKDGASAAGVKADGKKSAFAQTADPAAGIAVAAAMGAFASFAALRLARQRRRS